MKQHLLKAKTILLLISITLLMGSCEIFDPIFNPQKDVCILQKTSWSIPNDPAHGETEFIYDSSGKLIEIIRTSYDLGPDPYIERWTMTYQGDLVHEIVSYTKLSNPEEALGEYLFIYNGNLPDTIKFSPEASYNNQTYTVTQYSGDKLIKLVDHIMRPTETVYSVYNTTEIEWTGDNISKTTATDFHGSQRIYEYEYDDKKTPLAHLGLAMSSFGSLTMLSKNNVTKTTYSPGISVHVFEYTYTYNSTDYPISSSLLKDGYPTNYEYDCK